MWQGVWQFLNTNASGIQAVVVILAFVFAITQTRRIRKQLRLSSIAASSVQYKEMNQFVREHDDIAKLFNVTSERERGNVAAGVVFSAVEARCLLNRAGFLRDNLFRKPLWESGKESMISNFARYDILRTGWEDYGKEYYEPFRKFIEKDILRQDILPEVAEWRAKPQAQTATSPL